MRLYEDNSCFVIPKLLKNGDNKPLNNRVIQWTCAILEFIHRWRRLEAKIFRLFFVMWLSFNQYNWFFIMWGIIIHVITPYITFNYVKVIMENVLTREIIWWTTQRYIMWRETIGCHPDYNLWQPEVCWKSVIVFSTPEIILLSPFLSSFGITKQLLTKNNLNIFASNRRQRWINSRIAHVHWITLLFNGVKLQRSVNNPNEIIL
jgi:hypothetical protein